MRLIFLEFVGFSFLGKVMKVIKPFVKDKAESVDIFNHVVNNFILNIRTWVILTNLYNRLPIVLKHFCNIFVLVLSLSDTSAMISPSSFLKITCCLLWLIPKISMIFLWTLINSLILAHLCYSFFFHLTYLFSNGSMDLSILMSVLFCHFPIWFIKFNISSVIYSCIVLLSPSFLGWYHDTIMIDYHY